jgi:molybdopterin biosynthesis enzyme
MQIAIRPAKPFALGRLDGTPILGLPGNPVSSFVSFALLARPALRRMAGRAVLDHPRVRALVDVAMPRRPDGKTHFVRVRTAFDGSRVRVAPVGAQGSHQLAATAGADGLAVLPDGDGVATGGEVDVVLLAAEVTLATSP